MITKPKKVSGGGSTVKIKATRKGGVGNNSKLGRARKGVVIKSTQTQEKPSSVKLWLEEGQCQLPAGFKVTKSVEI